MKEIKVGIIIKVPHPELIEDIEADLDDLKEQIKYTFPEATGYDIYTIEVLNND